MGAVEQAVAAIQSGRPVILPTDTVYGLCASPYREGPVAAVYRLKGRPETIPFALLCADLEAMFECVPELRGRAGVQARAVLPGPYTLILPNPARRFRWLNGLALDTIGIRVPGLQGEAGEVLARVGAVAATSANRHRGIDPKRLEDVPGEIRRGCGAELDGGELPGVPSTVLDLTGREPRVIREGAGSVTGAFERLAAVAASK
jgi:L-threonylcarbamoyladenylate synthase